MNSSCVSKDELEGAHGSLVKRYAKNKKQTILRLFFFLDLREERGGGGGGSSITRRENRAIRRTQRTGCSTSAATATAATENTLLHRDAWLGDYR